MIVYIDGADIPRFDEDIPESDERIPCKLVAVTENGLDLSADTWGMSGFEGTVYDEDGKALVPAALALLLKKEEADALMAKLVEAGELDDILSHAQLLDRLLDALETVPLLRELIRKLRNE